MNLAYISVVIPTYNGKSLLEKNLPNILETLLQSALSYEIIIVDDASSDDTIPYLKENFPSVRIVQNEKNLGFSKTMNEGIKAAKYDWILALNNDMRLPANFFQVLQKQLKPELFSISCLIKDGKGEKILESAKAFKPKFGKITVKDREIDFPVYSLYSCGGCALYNRGKLLELNGFDEIFSPFYYEDLDLSLRAWHRGWKSVFTPYTFCYHDHSQTIKSEFARMFTKRTINRNKLIIGSLYLNGIQRSVFYLSLLLKYLFSLLLYFLPKRKVFVLAVHDFVSLHPEIRKRRNTLRQTAVLRFHEIISLVNNPKSVIRE
jgi:Predicted glycosyltransferases